MLHFEGFLFLNKISYKKASFSFVKKSLYYSLTFAIVALLQRQGSVFRVVDKLAENGVLLKLRKLKTMSKNNMNLERLN